MTKIVGNDPFETSIYLSFVWTFHIAYGHYSWTPKLSFSLKPGTELEARTSYCFFMLSFSRCISSNPKPFSSAVIFWASSVIPLLSFYWWPSLQSLRFQWGVISEWCGKWQFAHYFWAWKTKNSDYWHLVRNLHIVAPSPECSVSTASCYRSGTDETFWTDWGQSRCELLYWKVFPRKQWTSYIVSTTFVGFTVVEDFFF